MIAQTNHGIAKISPKIYGDNDRHIVYYKDSKKFKLSCSKETKRKTLKKIGEKYGKRSKYYQDIKNFKKLKYNPIDYKIVDLPFCRIESIDVSNNTELVNLRLWKNILTSIDVSNNIKLKKLHLGNNNLTSIDVSNNTELTYLYLENNDLISIDVSENTKLKRLDVYNNPNLKEITIKKGQKISIVKDNHTKIIEV